MEQGKKNPWRLVDCRDGQLTLEIANDRILITGETVTVIDGKMKI